MLDVQIIYSPSLLHLYDCKGKNVVVIDILRATSTICTAIAQGALSVRPVNLVEEALILKDSGYLTAAERDGAKLEGFDMGNSPFECMDGKVKNKKIALTTTNGTKCITAAKIAGASHILAGSFLNITATAEFLKNEGRDVILFCAGWKDKVNLEDTLFAGALAQLLCNENNIDCDSTLMAMQLYKENKNDLFGILKYSSHYKRLSRLHHKEDMEYCMQSNIYTIVVGLLHNEMVQLNK